MGRPKKIVEEVATPQQPIQVAEKVCYNCNRPNPSILSGKGHWFCSLACQSTKGE